MVKKLKEFRYAANLNIELIAALKKYATDNNAANYEFYDGLTFDAMIDNLERVQHKLFCTDVLIALKSTKTDELKLKSIMDEINYQIAFHYELKDHLSRLQIQ